MQSKSKPFDDLSNLMTNAMGAVKGVGDEVKAMGRARAESLIADMDLVGRDEFEAFKKVIQAQAAEIDALKAQVAKLAPKPAAKKKAAPKRASTIPAAAKAAAKAAKKPAAKKAPKKTAAKKPAPKKTARAKKA